MAGLTAAQVRKIVADTLAADRAARVAPAAAVASDEHIGPSGKPDGRRFACSADKPCSRLLRSEARAKVHGVEAGGHEIR